MKQKTLIRIAEGVYRRTNNDGTKGSYFERVQIGGRNTFRKLAATRDREAVEVRAVNRAEYLKWTKGVPGARNPYDSFVGTDAALYKIIELYKAIGCPLRSKKKARASGMAEQVAYALDTICKWPGWREIAVENIDVRTLTKYEKWRRDTATRMFNGRTIDIEIAYLSGALRWAAWQGLIPRNPLAGLERPAFQNAVTSRCRDARPDDAKELHTIARELFERSVESEVLGWQYLIECFTGLRTSEALALRMDAKPGEPGSIESGVLHIKRAKGGVKPFVTIHPALLELLVVFFDWHEYRFPRSPWWFPSPSNQREPLHKRALAQGLRIACPGKRRTSHGARAYYVAARRSEFVDDGVIAAEIGDRSGAPIINQVYGGLPPNWLDTKVGKITFLPDGPPAWAVFRDLEGLARVRMQRGADAFEKSRAARYEKRVVC